MGQSAGESLLYNVETLLSQLSVSTVLHGCHLGRCEAAVLSVRARVLSPDPPHAAAGHGGVGVVRRDPEPPADVLSVGAVAQGGGLASVSRWRQRVLVQEDGLQQGAPQHQSLKQRRRGDAGAAAPPAAQLLLGERGGSAAVALTPGRAAGFGVRVGFVVKGRLCVVIHASTRLQQRESGSQVSCVLLSGQEHITEIKDSGCNLNSLRVFQKSLIPVKIKC